MEAEEGGKGIRSNGGRRKKEVERWNKIERNGDNEVALEGEEPRHFTPINTSMFHPWNFSFIRFIHSGDDG